MMGKTQFRAGAAALTLATALGFAGAPPASAQEVVQAVPPREAGQLADALRTLATRPNDLDALLRAGNASLVLNDDAAAAGFFSRAAAQAPADPRVLLGTARVALAEQRPVLALQAFAQAEAAGAPRLEMAADRGLAFDLVGDARSAQALYRSVLAAGEDTEVRLRLALSLAMSDNGAEFENVLRPLLEQGDRSAFRTRAFGLAIMGRPDEAVAIADTMLPTDLALRMAPYLRYMPRLTRAQQAAAANLGVFPAVAEMGRDTPDVAGYAQRGARIAAQADSSLTPAGPALGARSPARPQAAAELPPRTAAATPSVVARSAPAPAPAQRPTALPAPRPLASAQAQPITPAPAPAPLPAPAPTLVAEASPLVPAPAAAEEREVNLAEAFADLGPAPGALPASRVGGIDITSITPAREEPPPRPAPAPKPAPAPPPEPSRVWVQVAVGKDTDALAFDWRRFARKAGGALAGKGPWVAKYGVSQRLLAGPYPNAEAARDAVKRLKEQEIEALPFTSAAGERVAKID